MNTHSHTGIIVCVTLYANGNNFMVLTVPLNRFINEVINRKILIKVLEL